MPKCKLIILLPLLLCSIITHAQSEKKKGAKGYLYLTWGYNKDWFSKSDIHFDGDDYNFTLYDVKAKDRPNWDKIFAQDISFLQFIYRVGYIFGNNSNYGIEIGFDHAKYIMIQDQIAHVEGTIQESSINKDTMLTSGFVRFEHTNGANFLMFNVFRRNNIHTSQSGNHQFLWIIKPGAGIVIPQSSVALFGVNQDNNYHIAGYVIGLDNQVHYEYKHGLFAETGFKYSFANYTHVLSVGDAQAHHHFTCLEYLIAIGYNFGL